ncbi:MAG: non-ribosomal peptide synthetase, partial [Bacteroidota bacterium]
SVAFDASVWEIYPTLVNGGILYPIADSALRYNVEQLAGFLKMHQITHTFLPPQMVQELVRLNVSLSGLTILTGGDVLKLSERNTYHIFNNYGPTENTVVATYFDTQQSYDGSIPIGKPIHNTTAFILSDELELQPVGVVGELCLAGDGLARGYWNRPALTATKFVQHPFDPTARLYRTGDLARWLPDGNIEFVGRKDTQIKIRGYRIELEEIEQVLLQQAEVVQALALVRDIQDNKAIIAYLVTDGEWQKPLLRAKLAAVLPDYMIPSYFVEIDVIPLTANGKIDRKALPDISPEDLLPKEYVAPSTEIEHRLVQIWQEVLEVEKIGLTDNFFELGGQSIKATRVLSMIERQFHTRVDIQKIFVHPTIEFLALEIENANSLKQDSAKKAAKKIII